MRARPPQYTSEENFSSPSICKGNTCERCPYFSMVVEPAFPNPESALATDNERSNRLGGSGRRTAQRSRNSSRLGQFNKTGCHDFISAPLEHHLWQGLGRRPTEDRAGCSRKHPAVTGASKNIFFRAIEYGAGVMRAKAAESKIRIVGRPQQKTGTIILRVGEDLRTPNGNLPNSRNRFHLIRRCLFPPVSHKRAKRRQRPTETHPPIEPAAGDTRILCWRLFRVVQCASTFICFCFPLRAFICVHLHSSVVLLI